MKRNCTVCTGCPHGKRKSRCAVCKTARTDPPSSKRIKCEPESSSEMKQAPGPFTIRGYFGISGEDGR
ncbi:hypothetical protein N9L76_08325 [bacterium]|nr:hypothetical protein [bacterium]